MQPSTKP
jgi:calcium release-activated calcium channel protein 1